MCGAPFGNVLAATEILLLDYLASAKPLNSGVRRVLLSRLYKPTLASAYSFAATNDN